METGVHALRFVNRRGFDLHTSTGQMSRSNAKFEQQPRINCLALYYITMKEQCLAIETEGNYKSDESNWVTAIKEKE